MNFIIEIFNELGFSEYAFAAAMGVSMPTVRHWLGKDKAKTIRPRSISIIYLVKLKKLSGWSATKFWGSIEEEFGG